MPSYKQNCRKVYDTSRLYKSCHIYCIQINSKLNNMTVFSPAGDRLNIRSRIHKKYIYKTNAQNHNPEAD